ncbi:MAG: sensor domain-containing diguanylate cyclase [Candidatus Theseobacter exili]|nr:sensor domain-containing diguanylate cyclase [Candidatus Theseobacter exili]
MTPKPTYDELKQKIKCLEKEVNKRKQVEHALRKSEERNRTLLENVDIGVYRIGPHGQFLQANPAAVKIFGYDSLDELMKIPISELYVNPEERNLFSQKIKKDGFVRNQEMEIRQKDGSTVWCSVTATIQYDEHAEIQLIDGAIEDITERKRIEKALQKSNEKYQKLSLIDDLTKLYNSRHFYNQLKSEIKRANRHNHPLTLLMLDVDNFKKYNDSFGHLEGNTVLCKLGKLIQKSLRGSDSAYRYGGEEFMVILPETEGNKGMLVAERIRSDFKNESFNPTAEMIVHLTVSIGIAHHINQEDLTDFIKRVDENMYKAKEQGKDRVFFNGGKNYGIKRNAKKTIYEQRDLTVSDSL